VLGSKRPAEEGRLVVLASGAPEARARCRVVFDALASRTLWLGPAGAGSRLKLVVNGWLITVITALADGIRVSAELGIEPGAFVEAVSGPRLPSFADGKARMMLEGAFPPDFPLRLAHKDLVLLLAALDEAGVGPGLLRDVEARFAAAEERGLGENDVAAVRAVDL